MSTTLWHDEPTAFVVDRDAAFCHILRQTARRLGLDVEIHASCDEFLRAVDSDRRGCVVVDPNTPRCSAPELLAKLASHGVRLPVIIVSTRADVPRVVEAMRAGAFNYLEKPCETDILAAALREAVAWDAEHARDLTDAARIRRRLGRLTSGERQVLEMLVEGMSNQEVAVSLGLSVRAIEVRRAKIRKKMRTKSFAELVGQLVADRSAGPDRRMQPLAET